MDHALLISAAAAAVYATLERYRQTSHGSNPWSVDGILGVISIARHIDRIAKVTMSRVTSVYRSKEVQRAVYAIKARDPKQWEIVKAAAKVRGVPADAYISSVLEHSYHIRGLAADFASTRSADTLSLAIDIHRLAENGSVGNVKMVLDEGDHVHVEWHGVDEPIKPPKLQRVTP